MKTTNNLINELSQMKQSKWILPALMAFALVAAFLGVTGCSPHPH
jgi:flagellar motor component MotA